MSKVFRYSQKGFNELRRSPEMQAICAEYANGVLMRAGAGFESETRMYTSRCGVAIIPATEEARSKNLKENTLLKALGG